MRASRSFVFVASLKQCYADTMSGRIEKPKKSRDNKEYRAVKSEYIRSFGFESVPCSRCFDTSNRCFVVDGINRCDGCFLAGRACDCPRVAMSSRASPFACLVR